MSGFTDSKPVMPRKNKVELHAHLDGSVRPSTVYQLAEEKGMDLGMKSVDELAEACCIKCPSTLAEFLKPFAIFSPVIVGDAKAIERIAYEFCEDADKQDVLYSEVRYSPHLLSSADSESPLTPRDVVKCVNRGLSRGEKDFDLTVRSILCCIRGRPEWSDEVVDMCIEFQDQGIVGIDVAGDEAMYLAAPEDIAAFRKAFNAGIHRTVHAGEAGPAENVRIAVEELKAERIGHGYHVLDDPHIYEECLKNGVHFETCPYSSCLTGSVPQPCSKHPIVRFAEDGANFSISRDDPTVIQKTLDEEYGFLRGLGVTERQITLANLNAARNCFLPENEKNLLIQNLKEILG